VNGSRSFEWTPRTRRGSPNDIVNNNTVHSIDEKGFCYQIHKGDKMTPPLIVIFLEDILGKVTVQP
jgi:hypothetical protein